MDNERLDRSERAKPWGPRLDRAVRELNAFLLVLAIGLATLDFTCFFAFKVRDALPSAARVSTNPALVTKSALASHQSIAALGPTAPATSSGGW